MPDCKDWNDVLVENIITKEKEHEQETKIIVK